MRIVAATLRQCQPQGPLYHLDLATVKLDRITGRDPYAYRSEWNGQGNHAQWMVTAQTAKSKYRRATGVSPLFPPGVRTWSIRCPLITDRRLWRWKQGIDIPRSPSPR